MSDSPPRPVLHVCVTCRAGLAEEPEDGWPGVRLHREIAALNARQGCPLEVREVACLAVCERGCSAAVSLPGQFGYLLGGLKAGMGADLLDYARRYAGARNGFVLRSQRAPSLAQSIMGRIPPV